MLELIGDQSRHAAIVWGTSRFVLWGRGLVAVGTLSEAAGEGAAAPPRRCLAQILPSSIARLRASLRARRMASERSLALRWEGFS